MSERHTDSNVRELPPPAWACPYGCGCIVRKASEAPYRGDNCPSCGGLLEEWAIEASASLRFTAGFSTEALEGLDLKLVMSLYAQMLSALETAPPSELVGMTVDPFGLITDAKVVFAKLGDGQ